MQVVFRDLDGNVVDPENITEEQKDICGFISKLYETEPELFVPPEPTKGVTNE